MPLSIQDIVVVLAPVFTSTTAYETYAALIVLAGVMYLMRPRRFYFIRHGETVLNAEHIRQGPEGELSEKGRREAERVGAYLAPLRIHLIISSTYPRAKETAGIIAEEMRAHVVTSPLFVERRNPSEIIGKSTLDPEVVHIVDEMDLAYHDDDFRHSDEETFLELKRRAKRAVRYLIFRGAGKTVVVTHHHFLKMLVAYILYRRRLHARDFVKLSFFNYSDNAAVTICEFHPWKVLSPTWGWEIISFNERIA